MGHVIRYRRAPPRRGRPGRRHTPGARSTWTGADDRGQVPCRSWALGA